MTTLNKIWQDIRLRKLLIASLACIFIVVYILLTTSKPEEAVLPIEISKPPAVELEIELEIEVEPPSKITKNAVAICLRDYMNTVGIEGMTDEQVLDDIEPCVEIQLTAARLINKAMLTRIDELDEDSETQILLKGIVILCHQEHTNQFGSINFVDTLVCMNEALATTNEMLDDLLKEKGFAI